MNRIMHELYTFEDKTSDEVLLMNGFQHINQLIPYINDLQQENKELKDNWNKLKEWLEETIEQYGGFAKYRFESVYNKMQEIEGGMND